MRFRLFCLALIAMSFAAQARADCPFCTGGVCPIRRVESAPPVAMTGAPAVRMPVTDGPSIAIVPAANQFQFPVIRSVAVCQPIRTQLRQFLTFPLRLIHRIRSCR